MGLVLHQFNRSKIIEANIIVAVNYIFVPSKRIAFYFHKTETTLEKGPG